MDGAALRALRESRGQSQGEFADWLNGKLGRRYDNATISRWESAAERIPAKVAEFLSREAGRPARVIAVANQKGGVAKTTTTVNLAVALAEQKRRVLVIDCDPQSTATEALGIDPLEVQDAGLGLEDVLFGDAEFTAAVRQAGTIELLPCTIKLADAALKILLDPDEGRFLLRDRLEEVRGTYDFILLDCPPDLGMLTISALIAADEVLIPSKMGRYDVRGIPQLFETVSRVRKRNNPELRVLGIVPTIYNKGHSVEAQVLDDLRASLDGRTRFFEPIARSTTIEQAVYAGHIPISVLPKRNPIGGYRDLAKEIAHA